MKTTIEIPEVLFRKAKARAAMEGLSLREFFLRGLQIALQSSATPPERRRAQFPLVTASQGAPRLSDQQVYEALDADEDIA